MLRTGAVPLPCDKQRQAHGHRQVTKLGEWKMKGKRETLKRQERDVQAERCWMIRYSHWFGNGGSLEMSAESWERLRFCQCQTEGGQTSESWDVCEKLRKTQILSVSNWGRADFRVLRCLQKAEKDSDSVSVKLREGRLQSLEMSAKSWERLRFCQCQTEGGQTSESWGRVGESHEASGLCVGNLCWLLSFICNV